MGPGYLDVPSQFCLENILKMKKKRNKKLLFSTPTRYKLNINIYLVFNAPTICLYLINQLKKKIDFPIRSMRFERWFRAIELSRLGLVRSRMSVIDCPHY